VTKRNSLHQVELLTHVRRQAGVPAAIREYAFGKREQWIRWVIQTGGSSDKCGLSLDISALGHFFAKMQKAPNRIGHGPCNTVQVFSSLHHLEKLSVGK
jgi:hypothetical protein